MDDSFLLDDSMTNDLLQVCDRTECFSLTFLVDPFEPDVEDYVERISDVGGIGIKLHPYLQEFGVDEAFGAVRRTFEAASDNGLLTIVDCNYAGQHVFDFNGVRVAHAAAGAVNTPVVVAHAGNARVVDAFVTARAHGNIWLDTSFTLPWWRGSSIATDMAFAMEKMGMERWVWGTDMPYAQSPMDCLEGVWSFLEDHNLEGHGPDLFEKNAKSLLERVGVSL
jgi:predicted TIM-barrel fold metal-dependent hydrolase